MSAPELRGIYGLIKEVEQEIGRRPRLRLHISPMSTFWIIISVETARLERYLVVIPDPEITEDGKGWIETLSAERWASLRALVGTRVRVGSYRKGYPDDVVGTLLSLTDKEAIVDDGTDNSGQYYLIWTTIEPEPIEEGGTT